MTSAIPQIAANYAATPERGLGRKVYAAEMLPNMWEQTYLQHCTANIWGGSELLRRKGKTLVFTRRPVVQALDMIEGQPMLVQRANFETVEYTPQRSDYIAVADTPFSRYFSPYSEKEVMMSEGQFAILAKTQTEFNDFAIGVAGRNPENVGAVGGTRKGYAGRRSASFMVGTPELPALVVPNEGDISAMASTVTCPKVTAQQLLENAFSVLLEQTRSTMAGASPAWATMPVTLSNMIKLSLARQARPTQDTSTSWFFANVESLITGGNNLAGFSHLFMDNTLTQRVTSGAGAGFAPAGVPVFPLVYGRQMAICWDQVFTDTQSNILSQQNIDSVDRIVRLYDFYSLFDKLVGVAWFTTTPYAVA